MKISVNPKPAMTVNRRILKQKKLVYALAARKLIRYRNGRSRILYVGTTRKGVHRIATSVAHRSNQILKLRGVREMDVHVVSCRGRSGLSSWLHLERAVIARFRERYFEVPFCNSQLKNKKSTEKLKKLFGWKSLDKVLDLFEKPAKYR